MHEWAYQYQFIVSGKLWDFLIFHIYLKLQFCIQQRCYKYFQKLLRIPCFKLRLFISSVVLKSNSLQLIFDDGKISEAKKLLLNPFLKYNWRGSLIKFLQYPSLTWSIKSIAKLHFHLNLNIYVYHDKTKLKVFSKVFVS